MKTYIFLILTCSFLNLKSFGQTENDSSKNKFDFFELTFYSTQCNGI